MYRGKPRDRYYFFQQNNDKRIKVNAKAFCCGSVTSGFERVHKKPFYNFLELFVRGKINSFYYKFLILLGCRSRSYIIMYTTFKSSYFGMITIPLEVRILSGFVFTAIWIRLKNTHALGHCQFFRATRSPAPDPVPPSPKMPIRLCALLKVCFIARQCTRM